MTTEKHSKSPRSLGSSGATFSILAVALLLVLAVAWFIFGIVTDGIDAKLIALDSYDPEKTKVWERQYTKEALRGWAIPGLVLLSVISILCAGMVRSARDAWQRLQKIGAEQGEDAKPDNAPS